MPCRIRDTFPRCTERNDIIESAHSQAFRAHLALHRSLLETAVRIEDSYESSGNQIVDTFLHIGQRDRSDGNGSE